VTAKWPTEVPVLTSQDMCKHVLYKDDRCCLLGHAYQTFGKGVIYDKVHKALIKTCRRKKRIFVAEYNDSHTLAENAKVWNEAMAALGYTEIEDA
jgi:hypothetical protein